MRFLTAFATASLVALTSGVAHAASVEVRDAVARVVVVPEARSDVKVEVLARNPRLPIQVRTDGDRTVIDGDLNHKIRSCNGVGDRVQVHVSGTGDIAYSDMPQLLIRVPMDAKVSAGGAVFGVVGRSASLDLASAGCGDWTVGNVDGKMGLSVAGSGDIRAGKSGGAMIRIAGSGDVITRAVSGPLEVSVAGSGDVTTGAVTGPLVVKVAGSGDVRIAGGAASTATVSVAGSGNVDFDGTAGSLTAKIAGSGDVNVRAVTGQVSKAIVGSGGVNIG